MRGRWYREGYVRREGRNLYDLDLDQRYELQAATTWLTVVFVTLASALSTEDRT